MSRVYLRAAGPRGWPRENLGDICQVAAGTQEGGREMLPGLFGLCRLPHPLSQRGSGGRAEQSGGQLPPLRFPGLCDGCDSPSRESLQKVEVTPASASGVLVLWRACRCSGKTRGRGVWGDGVAEPHGRGGHPRRARPQGHIPDVARAGAEVIGGVSHADQAWQARPAAAWARKEGSCN